MFQKETLPFMMKFRLFYSTLSKLYLINTSIIHQPHIFWPKSPHLLVFVLSNILYQITSLSFHFRFGLWELFGVEWFHFGIFEWWGYMIFFASTIDESYRIIIKRTFSIEEYLRVVHRFLRFYWILWNIYD